MFLKSINRLDAHDRFLEIKTQSDKISIDIQDILNGKPFGEHDFYIFSHVRSEDEGAKKRLILQPRLTKPEAQENSCLFRTTNKIKNIKIIWIIPPSDLWKNYKKDCMIESKIIFNSIQDFKKNKKKLSYPDPDDYSDEKIKKIYKEMFSVE